MNDATPLILVELYGGPLDGECYYVETGQSFTRLVGYTTLQYVPCEMVGRLRWQP